MEDKNINGKDADNNTGFMNRISGLQFEDFYTIGFIIRMQRIDIEELGEWFKEKNLTPVYQCFAKTNEALKIVKIGGWDVDRQ